MIDLRPYQQDVVDEFERQVAAARERLPNKAELPRTRCKTYRRRGVSRPTAAACKTNNWRSLGAIAADLMRMLEAKQ